MSVIDFPKPAPDPTEPESGSPYHLIRRICAAGFTLASDGRIGTLKTLADLAEQLAGTKTGA